LKKRICEAAEQIDALIYARNLPQRWPHQRRILLYIGESACLSYIKFDRFLNISNVYTYNTKYEL